MKEVGIYQVLFFFFIVLLFVKPLGWYMARVYENKTCGLDKVLGPVEHFIYRVCRIESKTGMEITIGDPHATTGGEHQSRAHREGRAVDIRYPLDPCAIMNAGHQCGSSKIIDEKTKGNLKFWTGPNMHFEIPPSWAK